MKFLEYGVVPLMEVVIKALSPGINESGMALFSQCALVVLLAYKLQHKDVTNLNNKSETQRIVTVEKNFERLVVNFIIPIWEYGKTGTPERAEVKNILNQRKYGRHPSKNIY